MVSPLEVAAVGVLMRRAARSAAAGLANASEAEAVMPRVGGEELLALAEDGPEGLSKCCRNNAKRLVVEAAAAVGSTAVSSASANIGRTTTKPTMLLLGVAPMLSGLCEGDVRYGYSTRMAPKDLKVICRGTALPLLLGPSWGAWLARCLGKVPLGAGSNSNEMEGRARNVVDVGG